MSFLNLFKAPAPVRLEDELPPPVTSSTSQSSPISFPRPSFWNPFNQGIRLQPEADESSDQSINQSLNLSKSDRLVVFALLILGAVVCYSICIFMFPILVLKPRKFVSLWTLGSCFFLLSFVFLKGFQASITSLISTDKWLHKVGFIACMVMTLYSSIVLKSSVLAVIFAVGQLVIQGSIVVSYLPWAGAGAGLGTRVVMGQAESWMSD